jgi:dTDP-4-dehydrorhamnose reductase
MKILVTGSNGLLGQKLTTLLNGQPAVYLIATARGNSTLPIEHGEFQTLDIANQEEVNTVIARSRPDVIIHTAAMTQVDPCELDHDACWKTNVTAVSYLIEAARRYNVHLVHVSTDFIFDGTQELMDETAVPNPVNFYGKSKLEGERLIQESNIPWCILRTVLVYGVTQDMSRSNIVTWVKSSLEQSKTINVVNDQWRTPTLAEDLASGCYLAATKRATGIFNISGKDYMSVHAMATRTAGFFGLDQSLIKETDSARFTQPARRPLKTGFILEKARRVLGYEPHSFEEGLSIVASQLG